MAKITEVVEHYTYSRVKYETGSSYRWVEYRMKQPKTVDAFKQATGVQSFRTKAAATIYTADPERIRFIREYFPQ